MKYKHLTIEEREKIQLGIWAKESIREIAKDIGRPPSAVCREMKRKPTADEWEVFLDNRIPELIRQCKAGALDPAGINTSLQFLIEGSVITSSREVIITPPKSKLEKFAFFADLDIITVPDNYDHATQLASFLKKNRKKFYSVNENITNANFPNPTRILKPGDKLWVRACKQVVSGTTTSKERMTFLATQNAVHTGAQGASLVFEQKRDQLPKGYWYASFDKKDRLWQGSVGDRRMPCVGAGSGGDFRFGLGSLECVWNDNNAFLCFCYSFVFQPQI